MATVLERPTTEGMKLGELYRVVPQGKTRLRLAKVSYESNINEANVVTHDQTPVWFAHPRDGHFLEVNIRLTLEKQYVDAIKELSEFNDIADVHYIRDALRKQIAQDLKNSEKLGRRMVERLMEKYTILQNCEISD